MEVLNGQIRLVLGDETFNHSKAQLVAETDLVDGIFKRCDLDNSDIEPVKYVVHGFLELQAASQVFMPHFSGSRHMVIDSQQDGCRN